MPGLSLIDIPDGLEGKERALKEGLLFEKDYSILWRERFGPWEAMITGYGTYPFRTMRTEDGSTLVLEGRIYGPERDVERSLGRIGLLLERKGPATVLRDELLRTDGEFNIAFFPSGKKEMKVLTDPWNHLPLYIGRKGRTTIVSRELHLLYTMMEDLTQDDMGIAEFLVFEFQLKDRTFFKEIRKVPPGALVTIPDGSAPVTSVYFENDFDERAKRSASTMRAETISLLSSAIKARMPAEGPTPVLSLSGGLDSRLVLELMLKNGIELKCSSFVMDDAHVARDNMIAKMICEKRGIDLSRIELELNMKENVLSLFRAKGGQNRLEMNYLVDYLKKLKRAFGKDMVLVSGDTGGALRPRLPRHSLNDLDDLVGEILYDDGRWFKNHLLTIEESSELAGIGPGLMERELKDHLKSFPESTPNQKFGHFYFYNYFFKWHYESMDRWRHYSWPIVPLESTPFLAHSYSIPDRYLTGMGYYLDVLDQVDKELAGLPYANWDFHPRSMKYKLADMKQRSFFHSPKFIRDALRKKGNGRIDAKRAMADIRSNKVDLSKGDPFRRKLSWTMLTVDLPLQYTQKGMKGVRERLDGLLDRA